MGDLKYWSDEILVFNLKAERKNIFQKYDYYTASEIN